MPLYAFSNEWSFGANINFSDNLFLSKFNVNITKNKKKHAKDHFYADFG